MKVNLSFSLVVLFSVLSGCQSASEKQMEVAEERIKEYLEDQEKMAKKPIELAGIWKFEDVYASEELQEHHYMVLEDQGDSLIGRYYGTTDDFDDAREGYFPGFFVATMKNLLISNDSLKFTLSIDRDELFAKPVPLTLNENDSIGLAKWDYGVTYIQRDYAGLINKGQIEFDIYLSRHRVFKRFNSN